jgi:hypothetical protein
MNNATILHSLAVLRESLQDIGAMASALATASDQPEAQLHDVTESLRRIAHAATRAHTLWHLWHGEAATGSHGR